MTELQEYFNARNKEIVNWKKLTASNPKLRFIKTKKIGKSRITLLGAKDRGATMLVYSHLSNKDDNLNFFDTVNFMNWQDAIEEYRALKTRKDVLDIIRRNN